MEFTYDAYRALIKKIISSGYDICDYANIIDAKRAVVLRHDVDNSLEKARDMAKLEYGIIQGGVKSTYFVLLTSDFYNLYSKKSISLIKEIIDMGHDIGLHFDEKRYDIKTIEDMKKYVYKEIEILEMLLDYKVTSISMHRPSKMTLENDIQFDGLINSYGKYFFNDIKYVSDSRMNWREDVNEVIDSDKYNKIQILTHAFWYSDNKENMRDKINEYIDNASVERWDLLNDNFTNLEEVIKRS